MTAAPWRIAKKAGDTLTIDPADTFDGYRQAKREAMTRNMRRRHHASHWVVLTPSGALAKTGAEG